MTEKPRKTDFLKTQSTVTQVNIPRSRGRPKGSKNKSKESATALTIVLKKSRGRPKGSKNKSVDVVTTTIQGISKGRGRPKGAKNKPKETDTEEASVLYKKRKQQDSVVPIVKEVTITPEASTTGMADNHPLLEAVRWLEKYMHHVEMRYYKNRATKNGTSLHVAMMSDILGFFNVQNPEVCKQVKKNKLVHITSNELH